ncbi:hypothetical protein HRS9139_06695 [Pyrenophora teres f. teres]|nr:hypothetical protein HRS9139_06695 [Pyrenophora teres f. teres]
MDPSQGRVPAAWHSGMDLAGIQDTASMRTHNAATSSGQIAGAFVPTPPSPEPDYQNYNHQSQLILPTAYFNGQRPPTPPRHDQDNQFVDQHHWYDPRFVPAAAQSHQPRSPYESPYAPSESPYALSRSPYAPFHASSYIPSYAPTDGQAHQDGSLYYEPMRQTAAAAQSHAPGTPRYSSPLPLLIQQQPLQTPPQATPQVTPPIQLWPTDTRMVDATSKKKQEVYKNKGEERRKSISSRKQSTSSQVSGTAPPKRPAPILPKPSQLTVTTRGKRKSISQADSAPTQPPSLRSIIPAYSSTPQQQPPPQPEGFPLFHPVVPIPNLGFYPQPQQTPYFNNDQQQPHNHSSPILDRYDHIQYQVNSGLVPYTQHTQYSQQPQFPHHTQHPQFPHHSQHLQFPYSHHLQFPYSQHPQFPYSQCPQFPYSQHPQFPQLSQHPQYTNAFDYQQESQFPHSQHPQYANTFGYQRCQTTSTSSVQAEEEVQDAPPSPIADTEDISQHISSIYTDYKWPVKLYQLNPTPSFDFAQTYLDEWFTYHIYNSTEYSWHSHTTTGFIKNGNQYSFLVLHNAANPFTQGEERTSSTSIGVYGRYAHAHDQIHWTTIAPCIKTLMAGMLQDSVSELKETWTFDMPKASERRFHRAYWHAARMLPLRGLLNSGREPDKPHDALEDPEMQDEQFGFTVDELQTGEPNEKSEEIWEAIVQEMEGRDMDTLGGDHVVTGGQRGSWRQACTEDRMDFVSGVEVGCIMGHGP